MMKRAWLKILQFEMLAVGLALVYGRFFLTALIGPERVDSLAHYPVFPVLSIAGFIFFILAGSLFIAPVERFLRANQFSAYLIPLQAMFVLALAGMEILLRVTVYNQPMMHMRTNWFGSLPAPGSFYLWGSEGFALTHFEGIPGEIRTPLTGRENIILLGDSFLEGLQVADDQKLASVAEIELWKDGLGFDLHNLGASGLSMADYAATIPKYIELFDPATVVLVVQENDFVESFHADKSNYFTKGESGAIELVSEYSLEEEYFVADDPHPVLRPILFQYARSRIEQTLTASTERGDASPPVLFDPAFAAMQMEYVTQSCGGVPLIILIYPHAPYITGDRIEMSDENHERLREFLSGYPGIVLADPLPELRQLARDGVLPMGFFNSARPGVGHLNAEGNRVVGKVLAQAIEEAMK